MGVCKLDARLAAVASLVKAHNTLIDVGTDHAFLPCFLVQSGVCPCAIAADVRPGPLENAARTVEACALHSRVRTCLSDGLDALQAQKNCTVVCAGMGGLLIVELLSRTAWIFEESVQLVVQPMSHAEDVRRFFYENGFSIDREVCVSPARHCYCAMAAHYSGVRTRFSPAQPYGGLLFGEEDAAAKRYLQAQRARLQKRFDALSAANAESAQTKALRTVLEDFDRLLHASNTQARRLS